MRFTIDILTPLLLSAFVGGSHFAEMRELLQQAGAEQLTNSQAAPDALFVEEQSNQEAADQDLSRTSVSAGHERSRSKTLKPDSLPSTPLLFASNSARLTPEDKKTLELAATWLGQHEDGRVFIVGYCDESGSEDCTPALAEHRADAVRQFLLGHGVRVNQVAGVKGWENLERACRTGGAQCQQRNRSARLFIAAPGGS